MDVERLLFGTSRPSEEAERLPRDAFRPIYHLPQAVHEHHRTIERADHEIRFVIALPDLDAELWRDAMARNALATLPGAGALTPRDMVKLHVSDPAKDTTPAAAHARNYGVFLESLLLAESPALPASAAALAAFHGRLFHGVLPGAGDFRREPAVISGPEGPPGLAPAPPERIEAELTNLLGWLHHAPEHPLVRAEVFHHAFQRIHPFPQGNAEAGRALLISFLYAFGYNGVLYAPVADALRGKDDPRDAAFQEPGGDPNHLCLWLHPLAALLRQTIGQTADRVLFRRRLPRGLSPRTVKVAEYVASLNLVWPGLSTSLGQARQHFRSIPARTLQRDLAALRRAGVLEARGVGKGTTYRLAGAVDPVEELEERMRERGGG